jgi:hypothetical protein
MLAAILICGANMVTSCTNDDNPIIDPEPTLPDQAYMFVQNVLSDSRYRADVMEVTSVDGESVMAKVIRLDVDNYDEAVEEFMKLMPEGVAETAFTSDEYYKGLFTEAICCKLNAPAVNDVDTVAICRVHDYMTSAIGYAWVHLTDDLIKALDAEMIVYMAKTDEDDLANFLNCFINILPYCTPNAENPSEIICTFPSIEVYMESALAFITTKMMTGASVTEDGNLQVPLTDAKGNLYGNIIVLSPSYRGDALSVYVLDDALQASLLENVGIPISKLSFYVNEE